MSSPQQSPPPVPAKRRFLHSIPRFAAEVGLSERSVWRLIAAGKIKSIKISIGRTVIPDDELERVLSKGVL